MFYFEAEKQGEYFEGWSTRQFAFDTQRRHLYYTEREKGHSHDTHHHHQQQQQQQEPQHHWKKKLKIHRIVAVATVHEFHLKDPHLKETDFFTLEVHGKTRKIDQGEPATAPLLCPSTGPRVASSPLTASPPKSPPPSTTAPEAVNESKLRDPYQLCELYEALRDEFAAQRRNNRLYSVDSMASLASHTGSGDGHAVRTIQSPRHAAAKEKDFVVTLRCKNEGDFRRVWYVLRTVLGYDRLDVRPYRGLPPYDPRNGIPFAHIPMHLWHTFMLLEKTVFYTFMRGDLVGRGHTGEAEVSLPGAYLCITHDMVLVMRDNGTIPRWIRMHDVHTFECNTVAKRPFFAFLTDDPSPDILFIPTPPAYGPTAIAAFSGFKAVLSVKAVLQDACFASHGIRRVTEFVDANWAASVRAYYTAKEETRRFKFKPLSGFDDSLSCLIPKVQLAKVWQEVLQEQRSRSSDDVAAIPLGGAGTGGGTLLSSNEISTVRRRMDVVQSRSSSEIVGMPLDRLLGSRRERLATSLETPTIRPDSFVIAHQQQEVVYQQPGTCYLPSDASLMVVQPGHEPHFGPESNVAELVNTSLVAIGAHAETKGCPAAKEGAEPHKQ